MSNVRVQHVWVDLTGSWFSPDPGLLLEWRHVRTVHGMRWQGLVVYVATHSVGGGLDWTVRQNWLDAHHIRNHRT